MDSIVVAGGRPTESDPLYQYTQGQPKALLKFGGRPMVDYVVSALMASQYIDRIVIIGLDSRDVTIDYQDLVWLPDHGGIVANGFAGLDWLAENQPGSEHILICSCDIPTLTTAIVDEFIRFCLPLNYAIYYSMVTREILESRFPGSQRTFVRLQDFEVAGGDIFVARPDIAQSFRGLIEELAAGRKNAWKLAKILGPLTLTQFLLGRLSAEDIERKATNYIGYPVRIIFSPHAEIAMDVDKPHHVEIIRANFSVDQVGH